MTITPAAIALAALCATTQATASTCAWTTPGADRYTGSPVLAVLSYSHIPAASRVRLAVRLRAGKPDELVDIARDGVLSRTGLGDIHGMHFGRSRSCDDIDRSAWAPGHTEPARAWCDGNWCIVSPDVCGNISWALRDQRAVARMLPVSASPAPEPGSLALVVAGLLLAWRIRKT